jgi:hypothetical protein
VIRWVEHEQAVTVLVGLELQTIKVPVDRHGVALWRPKEREVLSAVCARCDWTDLCRGLSAAPGTALTWRRLGFVDAQGDADPTRPGGELLLRRRWTGHRGRPSKTPATPWKN